MQNKPKISRKDFLRLKFFPQEVVNKECDKEDVQESADGEEEISAEDISHRNYVQSMQTMNLPPEFRSLYKVQAEALGMSSEDSQKEAIEQEMLKALWNNR